MPLLAEWTFRQSLHRQCPSQDFQTPRRRLALLGGPSQNRFSMKDRAQTSSEEPLERLLHTEDGSFPNLPWHCLRLAGSIDQMIEIHSSRLGYRSLFNPGQVLDAGISMTIRPRRAPHCPMRRPPVIETTSTRRYRGSPTCTRGYGSQPRRPNEEATRMKAMPIDAIVSLGCRNPNKPLPCRRIWNNHPGHNFRIGCTDSKKPDRSARWGRFFACR